MLEGYCPPLGEVGGGALGLLHDWENLTAHNLLGQTILERWEDTDGFYLRGRGTYETTRWINDTSSVEHLLVIRTRENIGLSMHPTLENILQPTL